MADLVDGKVADMLPPGEALALTRWQTVAGEREDVRDVASRACSRAATSSPARPPPSRRSRPAARRRTPSTATSGKGVRPARARGVHQPQGRVRARSA
ncbi:MAG: hypothetical protein MZV64_30705 [Ignavibacteriales bacterium]|nr:hypothetical protein [Ignavibacteriales bacterium]